MLKVTRFFAGYLSKMGTRRCPYILSGCSLGLQHKNFMLFSRGQSTPQRILEMISYETKEVNLEKIFVELSGQSDKLKQQVVRKVVQRVLNGQLDSDIIANEKFSPYLKKFPILMFDIYFTLIAENIANFSPKINDVTDNSKKQVIKMLNQYFVICFDCTKKMKVELGAPKEITLYKCFAQYHIAFMSQIVQDQKSRECLVKGKNILKTALTKIMLHAKTLYDTEKKLAAGNHRQGSKEYFKLEETRMMLFEMFQNFSEVLFDIVDVQKEMRLMDLKEQFRAQKTQKQKKAKQGGQKQQKQDKSDKKELTILPKERMQKLLSQRNPSERILVEKFLRNFQQKQNTPIGRQLRFEYPLNLLELYPIIEKGIQNYNLLKDWKHNSKHYYQLRKLKIEMSLEKRMRDAEAQGKSEDETKKIKQQAEAIVLAQMEDLYADTYKGYRELVEQNQQFDKISELAVLLSGIKIFRYFMTETNNQVKPQQIFQKVGEDVQIIVNHLEDAILRKTVLNDIIKGFKLAYNFDLSPYVQKVPRSIRVGRRRKMLQ